MPSEHRRLAIAVAVAAVAMAAPFAAAVPGVHWDDAYIFFRFADNLVEGRGWGFNPGETSGGTTSVLWTLILAGARLVAGRDGLPLAAKLLGILLHALGAGLWAVLAARWSGRPWLGAAAGLLIAANPVLVLLAVSGMETPLVLLLLALAAWELTASGFRLGARTGLLAALLAVSRPEVGATFLAAAVAGRLARLWTERRTGPGPEARSALLHELAVTLAVTAIALAPLLAFNQHVSGQAMPSTRVGKMIGRLPQLHAMSYADFRELGAGGRLALGLRNLGGLFGWERGGIALAPWAALLLVGAPWHLRRSARRSDRPSAPELVFLWTFAALLLGLLCLVFPIPNPRYAAPLGPLAIAGSLLLLAAALPAGAPPVGPPAGPRATLAAGGALLAVCVLVLAGAHRLYVPHAREQQLRREVGEWLRGHTEAGAVIALEPVGEIGYYAERPILDLGGLTDRGVWPCLERGYDDPGCALDLFEARRVDYLIDYPPGYPLSFGALVERYPERFSLVRTFHRGGILHLVYRFGRPG